MTRTQLKRMALTGLLPLASCYLRPARPAVSLARRMERDGWSLFGHGHCGGEAYRSYVRQDLVDIPRNAALPHYPAFASSPDYWMYGEVRRLSYLHEYVDQGRTEGRGDSYHVTPNTKTFDHMAMRWAAAFGGGI